jgi:hypothetical protein
MLYLTGAVAAVVGFVALIHYIDWLLTRDA